MTDIKPYKEQEEDFLYLKIPMKDACKFLLYNEQIKQRLSNNKTVPLRFYNKMLGLFRLKDHDEEEYYKQAREVLTKSVCDYFKNDKEYYFSIIGNMKNVTRHIEISEPLEPGQPVYKESSGLLTGNEGVINYEEVDMDEKKKRKPGKHIKITYTFEQLIENVLLKVFHVFSIKKNTKEDVLQTCYLAIAEFAQEDKKIADKISHYKASVISGYIAMRFGHTLSKELSPQVLEKNRPTNGEIYNAVKHCTDPLNPDKKKKK